MYKVIVNVALIGHLDETLKNHFRASNVSLRHYIDGHQELEFKKNVKEETSVQ